MQGSAALPSSEVQMMMTGDVEDVVRGQSHLILSEGDSEMTRFAQFKVVDAH